MKLSSLIVFLLVAVFSTNARGSETLRSLDKRFAKKSVSEKPSFQRHVLPLMGRLGCNGRACHGSFQGRGGFRLSLFGYDFKVDHQALLNSDNPRVDLKAAHESLILTKPISKDEDEHGGGLRFEKDSWEYRVLHRWVESGAKNDGRQTGRLIKLEITPKEILFTEDEKPIQLRAIAHWSDGSKEDVTPLCRFRTNDSAVAKIDENGIVKSAGQGDTHVIAFYDNGVTPVPVIRPYDQSIVKNYPNVKSPTKIDQLVVNKLKKLGVVPSPLATDVEFLRRISLDMTGTLPEAEDVRAFLEDSSPHKREKKIEQLLNSTAYAAWWATKFCDLTGNNSQNSGNNVFREVESRQWYEWIYSRLKQNTPYDDLVAGIVLATGRTKGQSFDEYCKEMGSYYRKENPVDFGEHSSMPHYWSRRNVRKPEEKALSFAYAFMGIRIQCAQCHKHPFDQWSKEDFTQFTSFFSGIKYGTQQRDRKAFNAMQEDLGLKGKRGGELRRAIPALLNEGNTIPWREVFVSFQTNQRRGKQNLKKGNKNPVVRKAKLLGAEEIEFRRGNDPRDALMTWLRSEKNRYFARSIVNRIWANYFHVGIVEPPDDLNMANPAGNEPLLAWLTDNFVENGYDLKWLHRTITMSRTYQSSWRTNDTNRLDQKNFSHAVVRRLPAEVVYDSLQQVTLSDAKSHIYKEDIDNRSIGPKSGLGNLGRNATGYALMAFGKPQRTTNCDCERSVDPSLLQTLYLRNDAEVLAMVDRREGWLEQVAREHQLPFKPASTPQRGQAAQRRNLNQLNNQLKQLNQKLEKAQKAEETSTLENLTQQQKQLKRRIAAIRNRLNLPVKNNKALAGKNSKLKARKTVNQKDQLTLIKAEGPALVHAAYLRTLSRPPTDQELARAEKHLQESKDLIGGLRDLLWALLNTKEFIINH